MAKSKQQPKQKETTQEEPYLFAIGTPEGDMILKIGLDGNILHFKNEVSLTEASRAFWNAFELVLPVTQDDIDAHPNDTELGAYIRNRMTAKKELF